MCIRDSSTPHPLGASLLAPVALCLAASGREAPQTRYPTLAADPSVCDSVKGVQVQACVLYKALNTMLGTVAFG